MKHSALCLAELRATALVGHLCDAPYLQSALTPSPSLKRRPATAAGLSRAAALVHHRPHGQAHLPPRSAWLAR